MTNRSVANRPNRWLLFLVLPAVLILTACDAAGFGNIVTQSREVGTFRRIDVSDGITLHLTVDPTEPHAVTASFDDNLIEKLTTRVEGDTLVVEFDGIVNVVGTD